MNAQAQRVDVLAVMDNDRRTSLTNESYLASDYIKSLGARSDVAELIAAASDAATVLQDKAGSMEQETSRRLWAVLARVAGGPSHG